MATTPVGSATSTDAYGLSFQSLLRIILTQLQYQDPLKPVDNYQFVSQLGQFAQLQQSQDLNDSVSQMLATQSSTLSVGLIGKTVDAVASDNQFSGVVQSVSFSSGQPNVVIRTADGQLITGVSIADISSIR
jgi:flagellar basal-body rod modification protein FlgD